MRDSLLLPSLYRLTAKDVPRAAEMLASAFYDNPFLSHVLPAPHLRRGQLGAIYRLMLTASMASGGLVATSDGLEGVAWLGSAGSTAREHRSAPSSRGPGWMGPLLAVLRCVPVLGTLRRLAIARRVPAIQTLVGKRLGNHLVLNMIAVDPCHQGEGQMSRLMRPLLAEADRVGLPVVLETDTERNRSIYQHFGFAVAEQIDARQPQISFFIMVRPPR